MRKVALTILCLAVPTGLVLTERMDGQVSPSKQMTNADVIRLVSAGLSEQVIIGSIRQAPVRAFDLTTTGLITLKEAHVPDAVIIAMQGDATAVKAPSSDATVPKDDTVAGVNEYLRQRVTTESRGMLTLSSFRKTNGYAGPQGPNLYVLEWQADVAVQQDIWKAGDGMVGYWQNFGVMVQQPGTMDQLFLAGSGQGGSAKRFAKGTQLRLAGDCMLRKTEQGWRMEAFTVKASQVVSVDPERPPSVAEPSAAPPTPTASTRSLGDLESDIDAGKEVTFPAKLNNGWDPGKVDLYPVVVTLSKTRFALEAMNLSLTVSPDKILEHVVRPDVAGLGYIRASRLHIKVAVKNKKGTKEDKKDYDLYSANASQTYLKF